MLNFSMTLHSMPSMMKYCGFDMDKAMAMTNRYFHSSLLSEPFRLLNVLEVAYLARRHRTLFRYLCLPAKLTRKILNIFPTCVIASVINEFMMMLSARTFHSFSVMLNVDKN